ncbi:hypothetical protein MBLNU457_5611t1 [Dothideomycetes sp. NU457]
MSGNNEQQPSLIGGHAQYVKGAVEGAIGSVTGAQAWTDSASTDKSAGIDAMKAASEQRGQQTQNPTFGKVEQMAGSLTGCEGMEQEGANAANKQQ